MPEADDDATRHEALRLDGPALEALAFKAKPPPLRVLGWQSPDDCWHRETGYSEETRAAIAAVERSLPKLPELRRLQIHGTDSWLFEEMGPDEFLGRGRARSSASSSPTAPIPGSARGSSNSSPRSSRVYIEGNRQRIERLSERHPGLAFERRSLR